MTKKMISRMDKIRIMAGGIALIIGAMIYLTDRPPDRTYFVQRSPVDISLYDARTKMFGAAGDHLPAFIHVFSFVLITAGVISGGKRVDAAVCLSWVAVNCAFELGQKFKFLSVKLVPGFFSDIPFLENTKSFFLTGTFDMFDLAAVFLGGISAWFVLSSTTERKPCLIKKKMVI